MDGFAVKKKITDDDIGLILEELGCEYVVYHSDYVTATKGGISDNRQGVVVWLNEFYSAAMYTTLEFDRYRVKDIFTVVQQIKDLSLPKAIQFVCNTLSITEDDLKEPAEDALGWLRRIKKKCINQKIHTRETALSDGDLNQFTPCVHDMWLKEGVTQEVAAQFDIGFDVSTEAITIPIRNPVGDVVGIKARATTDDVQSKYWYIYGCQKSHVLYGLFENLAHIKEKGEIVVFESEKSVLKACGLGIRHSVALGGKTMSKEQVSILNKLGVSVILALDNDVSENELEDIAQKINYPIHHNEVYFLTDQYGLFLSDKDSPADSKEMLLNYAKFLTREVVNH